MCVWWFLGSLRGSRGVGAVGFGGFSSSSPLFSLFFFSLSSWAGPGALSLPPSLFAARTWPLRGRPELIAARVLLFLCPGRLPSPFFSLYFFLPSFLPSFLSLSCAQASGYMTCRLCGIANLRAGASLL